MRVDLDKSTAILTDDMNKTNGYESNEMNTVDILESDPEIDNVDETEVIYQKFLKPHKKRETEFKKKHVSKVCKFDFHLCS